MCLLPGEGVRLPSSRSWTAGRLDRFNPVDAHYEYLHFVGGWWACGVCIRGRVDVGACVRVVCGGRAEVNFR